MLHEHLIIMAIIITTGAREGYVSKIGCLLGRAVLCLTLCSKLPVMLFVSLWQLADLQEKFSKLAAEAGIAKTQVEAMQTSRPRTAAQRPKTPVS